MKKVLAGFFMDGKSGGIDQYLLYFLRTVSDGNIQIDFLTNKIDLKLQSLLSSYGSRIFEIADLKHPIRQYHQVRRIIREEQYQIVYLNISTAIDCIAAIASMHEHVEWRLLHSHSSGNDCQNWIKRYSFNLLHYVCRVFLFHTGTHFYGCSKKAGLWMFPKKIVNSEQFEIIYNAVDRDKFCYRQDIREKVRREMGITDSIVIGHVGNFCYQKNHAFLIKVFKEVLKKRQKARLMLAGDGSLFEKIKRTVKKEGIQDSVIFLGRRKDVDCLFQGMDVFVLPSNFEGLPIAGIEAQCSKLPCILSDSITEEAKISDACQFISLKEKPEVWAEAIIKAAERKREEIRFFKSAEKYNLHSMKEQLAQIMWKEKGVQGK